MNVLALATATDGIPAVRMPWRRTNGANAAAAADLVGLREGRDLAVPGCEEPHGGFPSPYTPFDISDELELRYRYLLDQKQTRHPRGDLRACSGGRSVPVYGRRIWTSGIREVVGGNRCYDAYRHLATTYNMDRILTPEPVALEDGTKRTKMVNVNTTDELTLRSAVAAALFDANPNRRSADHCGRRRPRSPPTCGTTSTTTTKSR